MVGCNGLSQLHKESIKNRKIMVQAVLSIKRDPVSKITNIKRADGMVQVVEYLPTKCKALSSTTPTLPPHPKHP
jgi:hypothetical protein